MINCVDCINLRARIKLKNNRLQSKEAIAFCRHDMLWNNQRNEPSTFGYSKKSWENGSYTDWHREACAFYEEDI